VTDDYFETMRIPVRSGRAFTGTGRADGPGVLLINGDWRVGSSPAETPWVSDWSWTSASRFARRSSAW
jgi:hypothetical protein